MTFRLPMVAPSVVVAFFVYVFVFLLLCARGADREASWHDLASVRWRAVSFGLWWPIRGSPHYPSMAPDDADRCPITRIAHRCRRYSLPGSPQHVVRLSFLDSLYSRNGRKRPKKNTCSFVCSFGRRRDTLTPFFSFKARSSPPPPSTP